jgi:hypothetical protein
MEVALREVEEAYHYTTEGLLTVRDYLVSEMKEGTAIL